MPIRLYILINSDFSSPSWREIIAIYQSQTEAQKNQTELQDLGEQVLMQIVDTED